MGTRRPLIVQMVHDATALEPRCRLQSEDGGAPEYGPPIMPETAVADAIMQRTQLHLRELGGAVVSPKPIVMRVEYAYCANLTIIDTPGFILKVGHACAPPGVREAWAWAATQTSGQPHMCQDKLPSGE